ncbi:MAG: acyl-CoA dehydrogenase family protein [Deltaproteobacteria bacterium]|nr:acyl-CoA dehydrogenase family protein [Deltaproteobacteria bacterium]
MHFELSEHHQQIQQLAREFAQSELQPIAAENDRTHTFATEAIKKLGELGFMGIAIDEQYGGAGMDPLSYVLVIEEVARVCASTAVALSVNNSLVAEVLKNFGTEAQKQNYLIPVASGKKLGAYCLTEPMSGSDAATMMTTAVLDGDHYVINGAKNWITNGPHSDVLIVFAMTDASKGAKGVNAFVMDTTTPGIEIGKAENKTGIRSSSTCTISFTNVRVSVDQRLGDDLSGFIIAMKTLDNGRIGIASQAVGIAQAALDQAIKYGFERKQFGKPILENQGLKWTISEMSTRVEAARLLTYQAAYKKLLGGRFTRYSAAAKLFASETASYVADKALQIHGGYGYTRDYPVERFVRDARVTEIYEGTSEIQRLVVAAQTLKDFEF